MNDLTRHILKEHTGCCVEIRLQGFKGRTRKIRTISKTQGKSDSSSDLNCVGEGRDSRSDSETLAGVAQ